MAKLWSCCYWWQLDCVIILAEWVRDKERQQLLPSATVQSWSSLVKFQSTHYQSIIFFSSSRLISIRHTALILIYLFSFIYITCTELITFHIFLYMLGLTQWRCQSYVFSWFSISQPSCRGLWRRRTGLPRVTVCCVPIQKHQTALPPSSRVCINALFLYHFNNRMFQSVLRGQAFLKFLFI